MSAIVKMSYGLAAASVLCVLTVATPSYALSYKQAMAACKAKFGMGVTSVTIKKSGQIVCQEGPGRNATRKEVYDYCKKRYSATTVYLRKLPSGKWECRYYGRF